ncbi:MAG: hypothetical protein MZW92_01550 [Comamonadaceae bacterium]|nr:hypothetical protein [Comamonadaceae bacterium]
MVISGESPPKNDGDPIRRAGGHAQGPNLFGQKRFQLAFLKQGFRFLEQGGFIGRPAALGHEIRMVFQSLCCLEIDLGRKVCSGVDFLENGQRGHHRIAEILQLIDIADAGLAGPPRPVRRSQFGVLITDNLGRAGVLAQGQNALGGDRCVSQDGFSDESVVVRSAGIVEDRPNPLQESGPEERTPGR